MQSLFCVRVLYKKNIDIKTMFWTDGKYLKNV